MSDKYEQLKKDIKKAASPYNGFMKRTMDGSIVAIQELQDDNADFITTIESQNSQIESLKAITGLAVKGLKEVESSQLVSPSKTLTIARSIISEIARLSHE